MFQALLLLSVVFFDLSKTSASPQNLANYYRNKVQPRLQIFGQNFVNPALLQKTGQGLLNPRLNTLSQNVKLASDKVQARLSNTLNPFLEKTSQGLLNFKSSWNDKITNPTNQFYQQKVQPRLNTLSQNVKLASDKAKTRLSNTLNPAFQKTIQGFENVKNYLNTRVTTPLANTFQNRKYGLQDPKVQTDRNIVTGIFTEINQNGRLPSDFLRNSASNKDMNIIQSNYQKNEISPAKLTDIQFGSTIKHILTTYNKGNSFLTGKETRALTKLPATAKPEEIGAALRKMPEGKKQLMADFVQGMSHYFDKTRSATNLIKPETLGTTFPKFFETPATLKDPRSFISDASGKVKNIFDDPSAFFRGLGVNPSQIQTTPAPPPKI